MRPSQRLSLLKRRSPLCVKRFERLLGFAGFAASRSEFVHSRVCSFMGLFTHEFVHS